MGRVVASICATDPNNEGLQRTLYSLLQCGIPYDVYGLDQSWRGNGMKQAAAMVAANKYVGTYEFILVLDGYDILCLAEEQEIVEKFLAFRHPFVICGEMNCWPEATRACWYPPATSRSPFRFLNGGAYMARTTYLVAMMEKWNVTEDMELDSDQYMLTCRYLADPTCMEIDTECSIFQSLGGLKPRHFMRVGTRVISRITSRMPCILHGNGKVNMKWYWEMIFGGQIPS